MGLSLKGKSDFWQLATMTNVFFLVVGPLALRPILLDSLPLPFLAALSLAIRKEFVNL
jgi:hypothetical protein